MDERLEAKRLGRVGGGCLARLGLEVDGAGWLPGEGDRAWAKRGACGGSALCGKLAGGVEEERLP